MRRLLTLAVLIGAMLTMLLAAPAGASAASYPTTCAVESGAPLSEEFRCTVSTPLAPLSYWGWTTLNLNYCAPGMFCAAVFRSTMPAWRWSNGAWSRTTIAGGWVYVWPYTGEWRWAWTQESGWVAVTGGRFELPRPVATTYYPQ